MIYVKSDAQIAQIKKACAVWKEIRTLLTTNSTVGQSLVALAAMAQEHLIANGCTNPFYQYKGFPGYICISVNDTVIHGVPTNYQLQPGDLVTYDVGVNYQGYICDAAFSLIIGKNPAAEQINNACYAALLAGIAMVQPGNQIGDISHAVFTTATQQGYVLLEDFGGHGCGIKLHEEPLILNYGNPKTGPKLQKNMVICIEPMLMTENNSYYLAKDNWSVKARNKKLTCHWEHMVLVTSDGHEILTA